MKKLLSVSALSVLLGFMAQGKEFHTFSSADKSKTLQAAVVSVVTKGDAKFVVLETAEKKQLTAAVTSFSDEDQAYIAEQEISLNLRRNLLCTITENKSDPEKSEAGDRKITTTDVGFQIKLRNQGKEKVDDLEVKYQVVWKQAVRKANKQAERADRLEVGAKEVDVLESRADTVLDTVTVPITIDKANRSKSACST